MVVFCTQSLRELNSVCFTSLGLVRWEGSLKTERPPQSHHKAARNHEPERGDGKYHRQPCIFERLTLGEIVSLPRTLSVSMSRFHSLTFV